MVPESLTSPVNPSGPGTFVCREVWGAVRGRERVGVIILTTMPVSSATIALYKKLL